MNPERLAELQRQRALVREQLASLDREIAAAATPAPLTSSATGSAPVIAPIADPAEFQPDPVSAAAQTKRGCLLAAAGLLAFGALLLTALFYFRYRDHPLFLSDRDQSDAPASVAPRK